MGKNPAFQFYPSDWSRDLEEHPLEIEGSWIRIMCKLWWSETPGKSTKTLEQWSRILSVDLAACERILAYLKSENIGTIHGEMMTPDSKITVICRRMVRDHEFREIRRKCGKLGGNPKLKGANSGSEKASDSNTLGVLDNQISTTQVNQISTKSEPKPQPKPNPFSLHSSSSSSIKENRSSPSSMKEKENRKECALASLAVRSFDPFFEIFWEEYPPRNGQKRGKQKAFKEWKNLKPDQVLREKILSALKIQKQNYIDCKKHGEFVPEFQDPERWLRNRRWEDEVKLKTWQERMREIPE
jgi:hypothetical protein